MAQEISPREFLDRQAAGASQQLLDVREQRELEISALPGVIWIPMGEIPERLGELDRQRPVVVLCRSGGRSMRVANYLIEQGFHKVANLAGGILRWSRDIDPSLQTY